MLAASAAAVRPRLRAAAREARARPARASAGVVPFERQPLGELCASSSERADAPRAGAERARSMRAHPRRELAELARDRRQRRASPPAEAPAARPPRVTLVEVDRRRDLDAARPASGRVARITASGPSVALHARAAPRAAIAPVNRRSRITRLPGRGATVAVAVGRGTCRRGRRPHAPSSSRLTTPSEWIFTLAGISPGATTDEARQEALGEPAQMAAHARRAQHAAAAGPAARTAPPRCASLPSRRCAVPGLEREIRAVVAPVHRLGDRALEPRRQRHQRQRRDRATRKRLTIERDSAARTCSVSTCGSLRRRRVVGERLDDRQEVADADVLAQQVLQHLLHLPERRAAAAPAPRRPSGCVLASASSRPCTSWRPSSSWAWRRISSVRCVTTTVAASTTV